jgi:hypothetical protein
MQRLISLVVSVTIFLIVGTAPIPAAQIEPLFDVHRPTVVAFFASISQSKPTDDETNEALNDFQFYAERAHARLAKAGVDFHVVFSHSFGVRLGTKTISFRPGKADVGYYLVAPGKKPCVR